MQHIQLNIARILEYGSKVHYRTKVTTAGAETVTFGSIGARAAALAHALHSDLGICVGDRVGTFMYNCAEHLEALFAVPCMGAIFNPLNKHLMNDQIRHVINHTEDRVIIADPRLGEQLAEILPGCPKVEAVVFIETSDLELARRVRTLLPERVRVFDYESLLDGKATVYDWPVVEENTAAAICYSTGTVGAPKGVVYSHRSIYLEAMELRATDSMAVSNGESFLCGVPIYHVLSWGVPFAAFMAGTPLIFADADSSPETLAALIAEEHPRVAHGAPTIWLQLIVHYLHHPPERMSLTEIYVGGSPAPPILMKMWEERYGVDVVQVWGMTETSTVGTVARPPAGASGAAREAYRVSQGRFPAWLEYRVVNDGVIVSATDRNQGEIQVRGPMVTGSYFHSAAESASTFRGHEVTEGEELFTEDGWLRTGDVGSVTGDGYLTIHDRARDVIRSGGEWIYSATLENLIMNAPEVVEAAVIGYPDEKWGERPLAVTVLDAAVEPTAETARHLRDQLTSQLPSWMLPEYWTFVDSIDKTSVDKFDKLDLRKHLADGEFTVIELKD